MTLRLEIQITAYGSWSAINLNTLNFGSPELTVSYQGPAQFAFTCDVPQHVRPLPRGACLRWWDDAATDDAGTPFSASNPLFLGIVEEILPLSSSFGVRVVAYDPTYRAALLVDVMNAAYNVGTIPAGEDAGAFPQPPETAVPRLVYNAKIITDPDGAYQVGGDGTAAQIVAGLLEFCYPPLAWLNCAPTDGTAAGNDVPYLAADLVGMTVKPQEKLVFESESIRSAVERVCHQFAPRRKILFHSGTRRWRFLDVTAGTSRRLTLNDHTATAVVLSLDLRPSIADRYTAIKFYGPETSTLELFDWRGNFQGPGSTTSTTTGGETADTLAPVLASGVKLEDYSDAGGMKEVWGYSRWQIVDPDKRRGALYFPEEITVQLGPYVFVQVARPQLLLSWDGGVNWQIADAVRYDPLTGTVDTGIPWYKFVSPAPVAASTQNYFVPNAVRLVWQYLDVPLSVRVPETGFEGTAYTVDGLQLERRLYDESLSVGREFGVPVTTAERRAAFEALGRELLDLHKDISYSGGCTLAGIQYDFARLNRRVSFNAVDADGDPLETGWETITAAVTECEFDFENDLTTLTFSSDQLELQGEDVGALKQRLKIKALRQITESKTELIYSLRPLPSGRVVNEVVGVTSTPQFAYLDPDTLPPGVQ